MKMTKWNEEKLPETFVFKVVYKEDEDVPEDYNEGQLFKAVSISEIVGKASFAVIWEDDDRIEGFGSTDYDLDSVIHYLNDGDWEIVDEEAEING